jgi:hypothetical protein
MLLTSGDFARLLAIAPVDDPALVADDADRDRIAQR